MRPTFLSAVLCIALSIPAATSQTTPGIENIPKPSRSAESGNRPALAIQTTPGAPAGSGPATGSAACRPVTTGKDLEQEALAYPVCRHHICDIAKASQDGDRCIQALRQECADGDRVMFYDATFGNLVAWAGLYTLKGHYPYANTKEQVVVQACGIKFDSSVSVSLAIITPPESGLDIRGATPTTPSVNVTTGPNTDTLQAAAASINSALAATLPSTTTPAGLAKNPIITLATYNAGQYQPIAINATPADFALMVHAYYVEEKSTLEAIQTLKGTSAGTASDLLKQAQKLKSFIENASRDDRDSNVQSEALNQGAFDNAAAQAQQFAVKLSALDSAITLPNFPSRTATLAANYEVLAGGIKTLEKTKRNDFEAIGSPMNDPCKSSQQSSQSAAPAQAAPQSITVTTSVPGKPPVTNTISIPGAKPAAGTTDTSQSASPSPQQLEYCMVRQFLLDYHDALRDEGLEDLHILGPDSPVDPKALYAELSNLRQELLNIDSTTGSAFQSLNEWYGRSSVEFVDLLTPSTSNAAYRLGITATPMYVPFALGMPSAAGSSSSTASTVTAPATGHIDQSTLFFVHRRVNANLAGGFLAVHVGTKSYSWEEYGSTGNYVPAVTQSADWQVAAMASLNFFPWGRDYYPGQPVESKFATFRDMWGLMLGTSVTNLGTGFGGVNFEPKYGISMYAGIASAQSQRLADGVTSTTQFSSDSGSLPTVTNLRPGFAAGIGFDFGFASSIFKWSAPTLP